LVLCMVMQNVNFINPLITKNLQKNSTFGLFASLVSLAFANESTYMENA